MKKLIFAFIAMTAMTMEAQNVTDALRYSTSDLNGTARYRAMSGAFGALGGDLSSLRINPAGSAVFLQSTASFSLEGANYENEVNYFNGVTTNSDTNIDLSQAGAVFVFGGSNQNNDWRKFTLGFNYSKTADFQDSFLAAGTNTNSIDSYFLSYANGVPLDLLIPREDETVASLYDYLGETEGFGAQQALLGYQGFIINEDNPDDLNNTSYYSALGDGTFDQEYSYGATGMNGKFTFNFATQYQDDIYLGMSLNSHFMNYEKVTTLFEENNNPGSDINEIFFEERLNTVGSGFSFQLGGIAKLGDRVRIGGSYESPTWYNISEESTQYLDTYSTEGEEAIVQPDIVNVYPDYNLKTPGKYTGSFALLFGGQGLVSFDYSYKDYSETKFQSQDYVSENRNMEEQLKGASTYRLGAEYRLSAWSLRGGYRFEESPYSNETTIGDLQGYSFGLGFNFGNIKLDLAYDTAQQDRNPQLFQTGLTDVANINRDLSNYTMTLTIGL